MDGNRGVDVPVACIAGATGGFQSISGELLEISQRLAEVTAAVTQNLERTEGRFGKSPYPENICSFLEASLRAERMRGFLLEADDPTDPSWSILIQLMLARIEGRVLTAEELGIENERGHFWLRTLTTRGLVERVHPCAGHHQIGYKVSQAAVNVFSSACQNGNYDTDAVKDGLAKVA